MRCASGWTRQGGGNNLNGSEVLSALRAQNLQVSAGILNQPPVPGDEAYQINVETLGRLSTPEQFADIVVKSDKQGRVTTGARHRPRRGGCRRLWLYCIHGSQRCYSRC